MLGLAIHALHLKGMVHVQGGHKTACDTRSISSEVVVSADLHRVTENGDLVWGGSYIRPLGYALRLTSCLLLIR